MKNIYFILATIVFICSCGTRNPNLLLIEGNVYIPEKEVLLCEITDSGAYIIDRSYMKNHKYEFKGKVANIKEVYVSYGIMPGDTPIKKLDNKNYDIKSYIEKRVAGTIEVSGENENDEYLIRGELFLPDTMAYICTYNPSTEITDTIASTEMKDGNFKFECMVDSTIDGYIDYGMPYIKLNMMLENKKYKISSNVFKNLETKYITDSEEQNINNLFNEKDIFYNNKRDSLGNCWNMARRKGDVEVADLESKKYHNAQKERMDAEIELIKKYPNSLAAIASVYKWKNDVSNDAMISKFELLGDKYAGNSTYKYLKQKVDVMKKLAIGRKVDNFTLENIDGEKISLYDVKGSIKVLDFTASWCAPCRALNPHLLNLYKKYNDKGFEIIAVSLDKTREDWVKAVKEEKLPWAQVSNVKGWDCPVALEYNVGGIPYLVVLDSENRILGVNVSLEQIDDLLNRFYNSKK